MSKGGGDGTLTSFPGAECGGSDALGPTAQDEEARGKLSPVAGVARVADDQRSAFLTDLSTALLSSEVIARGYIVGPLTQVRLPNSIGQAETRKSTCPPTENVRNLTGYSTDNSLLLRRAIQSSSAA